MLEVNGRRLRARVLPDGSGVEELAVLGLDLEAVAGKGEPMSAFVAVQLPCRFFWAFSAIAYLTDSKKSQLPKS
jgi:hypothetical protein